MQQCVYMTLPLPKLRNHHLTAHSLAMHFHDFLIAAALFLSAFIYRHTHTSSTFSSHCPSFQSPFSTSIRSSVLHPICSLLPLYSPTYLTSLQPSFSRFSFTLWRHRAKSWPKQLSSMYSSHPFYPSSSALCCPVWYYWNTPWPLLSHRNLQPQPLNLHTALLITTPSWAFLKPLSTHRFSAATGGSTGFLIGEPFTQLPSWLPIFSSFQVSLLALELLNPWATKLFLWHWLPRGGWLPPTP